MKVVDLFPKVHPLRVYPGYIAQRIKNLWRRAEPIGTPADIGGIDQHQANGLYGIHQLRVRLPNDPTIYRVLIAPADAPIVIGKTPVDNHFQETIHG